LRRHVIVAQPVARVRYTVGTGVVIGLRQKVHGRSSGFAAMVRPAWGQLWTKIDENRRFLDEVHLGISVAQLNFQDPT